MAKIVTFPTEDGPLFAEIDDQGQTELPQGWEYTSAGEKAMEKVGQISAALEAVVRRSFAEVKRGLDSIEPDEVEIELGFKLTAEAGGVWVLAKGGGEAHIKVKSIWTRKDREKSNAE